MTDESSQVQKLSAKSQKSRIYQCVTEAASNRYMSIGVKAQLLKKWSRFSNLSKKMQDSLQKCDFWFLTVKSTCLKVGGYKMCSNIKTQVSKLSKKSKSVRCFALLTLYVKAVLQVNKMVLVKAFGSLISYSIFSQVIPVNVLVLFKIKMVHEWVSTRIKGKKKLK